MAEKIPVSVDPIALADRLRTAGQEMADENFHGWAFLVELAADAMVSQKQGPDRIAKLFEVCRRDLERHLPSMLSSIQERKL